MDPFSITVGVVGIIGAIGQCIKSIKNNVGPSASSSSEIQDLNESLLALHGVMMSFNSLHDDKDDGITTTDHLMFVSDRTLDALRLIQDFMASGRRDKALRGVKFDKKLKTACKSLDAARKVFSVAVLADQHTILREVEVFAEEVRQQSGDLSKSVGEVQSVQHSLQKDAFRTHIKTWLGSQARTDFNAQLHERNLANRHLGSGSWLPKHSIFKEWMSGQKGTSAPGQHSALWLRGSPGAGKSFLCSTAIEHVSERQNEICLYYFHQFDDQVGLDSPGDARGTLVIEMVTLLVEQLFRQAWSQDDSIGYRLSEHIKSYAEAITLRTIALAIHLLLEHCHQHAVRTGSIADSEPLNLTLFMDGLDDDKDGQTALNIIELFQDVSEDLPINLKLWISSRDTNELRKSLQHWPTIIGDNHAETDVGDFLEKMMDNLDGILDTEHGDDPLCRICALSKLKARAKGNFYYAKLMIDSLEDAYTVHDIVELVSSGVPEDLSSMFRRIFQQYKPAQHKIVSLLFSLVTFARRPMRINELEEAMTMAMSDPGRGLDRLRAPKNLQRLFPPLIQTHPDPEDPKTLLCRLAHSTVKEFLMANPDVLQTRRSTLNPWPHTIAGSRVGDVFLRYIAQPRYSKLIEIPTANIHESLSHLYDDTQQHALLPYCAKYWDRHLDDMDPTEELTEALEAFLKSSNFQSLIQIQSLFVDGHFNHFHLQEDIQEGYHSRVYYRRVWPLWFGLERDHTDFEFLRACYKTRHDYRHFVSEWGYLLQRGTCTDREEDGKGTSDRFRGQVDRCLTGMLGPTNFMREMKERYSSFMLSSTPFDYHKSKQIVISEAVLSGTRQAVTITAPSKDSKTLTFNTWDLDLAPKQVSSREITTTEFESLEDAAHPIAFSHDCSSFIFGNALFDTDAADSMILLEEAPKVSKRDTLSLDFDRRGDMVIIARRSVFTRSQRQKALVPGRSQWQTNYLLQNADDVSSEDEDDADIDDDSSSTMSDENSVVETCSERSTDFESDESEYDISEDEVEAGDGSPESSDSEENDYEDESENDDGEQEPRREQPKDALSKPAATDSRRPTYPGCPHRVRDAKDQIVASIEVYDVSSGNAVRAFHFSADMRTMLYQSPPIFHPHKPLLVWPLGGGNVMFADYVENTFFKRAIMPTTRDTRHISMKTHFSSCGQYLHIASIEGQRVKRRLSIFDSARDADGDGPEDAAELIVSLFLTTHRLSTGKTTFSAPRCVHRVKLTFGRFAGLSLAKLPITFTWTTKQLYCALTKKRLSVFRVGLFRGDAPPVEVPKLSVMLPSSAMAREVHYIPPKENSSASPSRGIVVLGSYGSSDHTVELRRRASPAMGPNRVAKQSSHLLDYACPAVGFYVDEEQDFGGWTALTAKNYEDEDEDNQARISKAYERFRDGKLIRKVESLNWDDDVDLERICDMCGRPYGLRLQKDGGPRIST